MSKVQPGLFGGAGGGGGVTDHGALTGLTDDDHTQYLLRSDVAASGAAGKPTTSGTVVGAGDQVYISGISVGDKLITDHGALGGLSDDDHTQYLLRSDFASSGAAQKPTTSGTVVGAGDQIYVSGIAVGDFLGAAAASVDLSAVDQPILPDTSGIRDVGSFTKVWASGFFDGIVLADNEDAGTYWKITVDSAGTLQTDQVT